jgi:hypothetical protein
MNWKRFAALTFALLAVVLFTYQPAWPQSNVGAGSIQGVVTDPQGGVVPNAKVTIINKDTGRTIDTTTTSAGTFSSGSLGPATYTVRVEAPSFKTTEVSVSVVIDVVSSANVKLELGSSSTVVEVSGEAVRVNTDQAQVSGTLTSQQIENLPTGGRNFLDLAQLEPGVQIQDGTNFDPTKTGFSSISFGGRFGRTARIEVDGLDVSDETVGTTTTGVPESAIAEFQLAQSSLDLSNELTSSGAVNVATKSGTNSIHGEGFGFFRDSSQAAALPVEPAPFQRSQYGGNVGGPIIKDKLFFFVDGEKTLQHAQSPVPVAAPFQSFQGNFPGPFHDGEVIGKLDYQATKALHLFFRYSFFQNLAEASFGGASFSPFENKNRTRTFVGGADFNTGSFTHSFRFEYLKFINNISDSVRGTNLPFADFPVSLDFPTSTLQTGPSFLAPQETPQSNRQVKYDGSKVWGAHILRYGAGYNHIQGGGFAKFFSIDPLVENLQIPGVSFDTTATNVCPNGATGMSCPLNYFPDVVIMSNGNGFSTEKSAFGLPFGGLGPDNRMGLYVGDSWKVKPNFTLTYGVRYSRDTGRTDSDLGPIPIIDTVAPGFGGRVKQPNHNFGPQAGFAWDPKNNGKMVIRAGIGEYFENVIYNNVLFDRPLRLQSGGILITPTPCFLGSATNVSFPGGGGNQMVPGGDALCQTAIGSPIPAASVGATCAAGITVAQCLANFQTAYQAAQTAAGPLVANSGFIGNLIQEGNAIPVAMFAPQYKTPRSIQMNVGVQRELRPGMVLTVDYLRNVSLHYLLGVDVNHAGDAAFLNKSAAMTAVKDTLTACGAASISLALVNCPGFADTAHPAGRPATISDFATNGLDSPGDLNGGTCPGVTADGNLCAFGGQNPNVGPFPFLIPGGRGVYNAFDLKWVYNVSRPLPGVKYLNFQASYTYSRFNNAGGYSTTTPGSPAASDQDFVISAMDNRNPLRYSGQSTLDRPHQLNFGGYANLPFGFRLGLIAHFWSALPATPTVPGTGIASIFQTDFTGDGTTQDPLPTRINSDGSFNTVHLGEFGRGMGVGGLNNTINNYNTTIAGQVLTPAGQALVACGAACGGFTQAQLIALGATPPTILNTPANQVGISPVKAADLQFSWAGTFWHERLTLTPSVGIYNVFNFANFDQPGLVLSGLLNGVAGSINGTAPADRTNRIGTGTGVFSLGAPRVIEWGLKLQF